MIKLSVIDDLVLGDHYYLSNQDKCYYFYEYTAREQSSYSTGNQFIKNFKKCVSRKSNEREYKYKTGAITEGAQIVASQEKEWPLESILFIPVPPSKSKSDPLYDDRLVKVLSIASSILGGKLNYKEAVTQAISTQSFHSIDDSSRPSPTEQSSRYEIDQDMATDKEVHIVIFDDMVTTGSHYKAMVQALEPIFPNAHFHGLFLARRVPQSDVGFLDDIDF